VELILVSAIINFTILITLAGIHFYWAMGGTWGGEVAVPLNPQGKKLFQPSALSCIIVAIGLLIFSAIELGYAQLLFWPVPNNIFKYGNFIVTFIFLLRAIGDFRYVGFFKKITSSTFARNDTLYYSPLCLLISLLSLSLNF
jgi:hypothetical protein